MVADPIPAHKEVLAWLIRVSKTADWAMKRLNDGNAYEAIKLVSAIAKLDANALNVITRVPNYETHVKPYHNVLVRDCKEILALSASAIQPFSPELNRFTPEQLASMRHIFGEALAELDRELKAEERLKHWLDEAHNAFGYSAKAWTYSQAYLENALQVLNELVKDENAIRQSVERFTKVFRGVKQQNPGQFFKDLLARRLTIKKVVEFILENAFKGIFNFNGRDWSSDLNQVLGLPEKSVEELKALREQLLKSLVFVKRNVDYNKLLNLLEKIIAIGKQARLVERFIEIAEEKAKEKGKTEEELLREYWKKHIHAGFVYHGTSSIFLPNIERFGLTSEGLFSEGTPFRPEDYRFFVETLRKAHGGDAPFIKYFTQDVTRGFFLDANYRYAVDYAKQGPERIRFMLEHIRDLEKEFRPNKFAGGVSAADITGLLKILRKYEGIMSHHRPVVLNIALDSPALLTVLRQNGEMGALAASIILDFESFKRYVQQEFSSFRTSASQQGLTEFSDWNILNHVQNENPLERFFHNRPLKGTIPWASIAKMEKF